MARKANDGGASWGTSSEWSSGNDADNSAIPETLFLDWKPDFEKFKKFGKFPFKLCKFNKRMVCFSFKDTKYIKGKKNSTPMSVSSAPKSSLKSVRELQRELKVERDEKERLQRVRESTIARNDQLNQWLSQSNLGFAGKIMRVRTALTNVAEYRIDVIFKKIEQATERIAGRYFVPFKMLRILKEGGHSSSSGNSGATGGGEAISAAVLTPDAPLSNVNSGYVNNQSGKKANAAANAAAEGSEATEGGGNTNSGGESKVVSEEKKVSAPKNVAPARIM